MENENIGILDPKGINLNPLNGQKYSENYIDLAEKWSKFPAYEKRTSIIETINKNQVTLITASTGSGKTVLVPKYTLHSLNYKGKIAVTLPKRVIAKSAAEFAAATLDVNVGENVSYKFKGSDSKAFNNNSELLYATDGTIVAYLMNDPELKNFDAVIIDEAHERKVQIDFLLYMLKNVIEKRPEFKLIIMSATIDPDIFRKYFSKYKFSHMEIAGKTNYEIKSIFLKSPLDYNASLNKGVSIVKDILNSTDSGDIIFFVTSVSETEQICRKVSEFSDDNVFCVRLYSGVNEQQKELATNKDKYKNQIINGKNKTFDRKIVVATNVAESSITVDGIVYVIDNGYELDSGYDPIYREKTLNRKFISNAQAKQRMGRAGRTGPGTCYHLYTKITFDIEMNPYPIPNIRKSNLSLETLKLLVNINDVDVLKESYKNFIEPPKDTYVEDAIDILEYYQLIRNNKISEFGKYISNIPGDELNHKLLIFFSKLYDCSVEATKIISVLSEVKNNISNIFIQTDKKFDRKKDEQMEKLKHKYGDFHSVLNIFDLYEKYKNDKKKLDDWSYKYFINKKIFRNSVKHFKKTRQRLRSFNINITDDKVCQLCDTLGIIYFDEVKNLEPEKRLLFSIIYSYRYNTAVKNNNNSYKTNIISKKKLNLSVDIDDNSFYKFRKSLPTNIIYAEQFNFMGKRKLISVCKLDKDVYNIIANKKKDLSNQ